MLQKMEREGLILEIERGKYLFLGLSPEKVLSNPLYIGVNIISPAYISFWSALHFHGLTEQVPHIVFIAATKRKSELIFRNTRYKIVTLAQAAFFGYKREMLDTLPVLVADQSKTILDCLAFPGYAGGILEIAKALQSAINGQTLDVRELVEYANRLNNGSLASRLGYLLEVLHQPTYNLRPSNGPVLLDPQQEGRGEFNSHWKLYHNIPLPDLLPQGVF